jgi:hypothetical protein
VERGLRSGVTRVRRIRIGIPILLQIRCRVSPAGQPNLRERCGGIKRIRKSVQICRSRDIPASEKCAKISPSIFAEIRLAR